MCNKGHFLIFNRGETYLSCEMISLCLTVIFTTLLTVFIVWWNIRSGQNVIKQLLTHVGKVRKEDWGCIDVVQFLEKSPHLEASCRYDCQHVSLVINLPLHPDLAAGSPQVHSGCCWGSMGWVHGEPRWNVYVPAQGCLQSYSRMFDSLQHRLATVYLSLFPTGFVCTIRAAERRSKRAAPLVLHQAATQGSEAKKQHDITQKNASVWLTQSEKVNSPQTQLIYNTYLKSFTLVLCFLTTRL